MEFSRKGSKQVPLKETGRFVLSLHQDLIKSPGIISHQESVLFLKDSVFFKVSPDLFIFLFGLGSCILGWVFKADLGF